MARAGLLARNANRIRAFGLAAGTVLAIATARSAPAETPTPMTTSAAAPAASAAPAAASKPIAPPPIATSSAPLPGANLDDCLSCHRPLFDGKKPHMALQTSSCLACHKPAESGVAGTCKSPKCAAWVLTAAEPALCARCHDTTSAPHAANIVVPEHGRNSALIVWGSGAMHPVIASKGCTACHDPHASANPFLAKTWPVEALCAKCHAKYDDAKFIHTAVKRGDCLGCHTPHGSDVKPLLLASREELCFKCHKPENLLPGSVKHLPVVQGRCLSCHDPHESDDQAQLTDTAIKLCATCHAAQAAPAHALAAQKKGGFDRAPGVDPASCLSCHEAHSSDDPHLLNLTAAAPK